MVTERYERRPWHPPHALEGSATVPAAIERVLACHPSIVVAILFGSLGQAIAAMIVIWILPSLRPRRSTPRSESSSSRACGLAGSPIDLIDLAQTHGPLLQQILTKGRLLICTDRTRYADLLLRVVYEEADVMPYYRRIFAERRQAWIGP